MVEIEIDPTTRIEGHHSTTIEVDGGTVSSARSRMDMYRGIEDVVVGRAASDAPQVTQMVCGVCFTCHRQASVLALEDAAERAGVFAGVPRNARLLRDVMEGMFLLWNHVIHLFALAGPDYSDAVADTGFERIDPVEGEGYAEALRNQRAILRAFTEFGGRAPHPLTYTPGGVAARPDDETVESVRETMATVNDWLGPTDAVPAVLEAVRARDGPPEDAHGLYDVLSILHAASEMGAEDLGVGPGRFYANGMFYGPESDTQVLPRGVCVDRQRRRPDDAELVASITEDTSHAFYTDDSGGRLDEAPPPEPAPQKEGAYSWGKAPRYDGRSMETGPLARLIAAGRDPFDLRRRLGGKRRKSSTLHRLVARAQEALLVRDWVEEWLEGVDSDGPFRAAWTDDFTGDGVGFWGASRGALSHWLRVRDGEVERYQILTPTGWNLGPRDADGNPSVFEEAVVGTPVDDFEQPIDVLRIIRSFDPCLGCAVHVSGPGDREYETTVEPHSPGGIAGE
jgi:hydrogenase large subunit